MAKGDMSQLGRQGGMQNMGNMGIGNAVGGFGGGGGYGNKMQNMGMGMQGAAQGMGGLRQMLGGGQQQQQPMQNKGFMGGGMSRGMNMGGDPRFQGGGQDRFNQMMSPFTQYNAQNAAMQNFMNGNIRSGSGLQSNMDVMSPIMSQYRQQGGPGEQNAQMPYGIQQSQGGYQNPNARY